jgi:hypothetical protein
MNSSNPLKHFTLLDLKLTRAVETDPRKKSIDTLLKRDCRPLWEKSTLLVPHVPLTHSLGTCLRTLLIRRQLERGLEHIDRILYNEQKGLLALQEKQATPPSLRVSRLFLVSNDGSERFYRACEKTVLQHRERVLFLCIDEPSSKLTQLFMNEKDMTLKALLVSDRDAVSGVLFSLVNNEVER